MHTARGPPLDTQSDQGGRRASLILQQTYSENLLRVLIGFFHYSVSQQVAIAHYGKPFHNLTDDEKTKMQNQTILDVMAIARQVDIETVKKIPRPSPSRCPLYAAWSDCGIGQFAVLAGLLRLAPTA